MPSDNRIGHNKPKRDRKKHRWRCHFRYQTAMRRLHKKIGGGEIDNGSGGPLCAHDFRRMFITLTDDLGFKGSAHQALADHNQNVSNCTDGYKLNQIRVLRSFVDLVEHETLKLASPKSGGGVAI